MQRGWLGTLLLASCMAGCGGLSARQRQLNIESFDEVWCIVRDQHFDPQLGGADWNRLRAELLPRVQRAENMDQARAAMLDLVSALHQSHFVIVPAEAYGLDHAAGNDGDVGLEVRVIDDQVVVVRVHPGGAAASADVRPGWIIESVGGELLAPTLLQLAQTIGQRSTQHMVLAQAVQQRLEGPVGTTVELVLVDGDGVRHDVQLQRRRRRGRRYTVGHYPPQYVCIEARCIEGDIGYIALSGFFDPAYAMGVFNEALVSFRETAGLIIDVRGNLGGISDMAVGMAGWLVCAESERLGTLHLRHHERQLVIYPRAWTYDGPVAVLVDGVSASTAEILAAGLQAIGRARVVGTRTAGAAQPSRVVRLPNGDGFQYAMANYVTPDGEVLEGRGVQPDHEVPWSRPALLQGHDLQLEAAIDWIRSPNK